MPPTPIDLRPLPVDQFDAFADVMDLAFHETSGPAKRARLRALLDPARTVVAFAGEQIVGTSGAYEQRLSIPGGELPCAGVTGVTVSPTHRRRGILTGMMAGLFEQAQAAGEPLAALWAAEGGIYERFGFGVASRRQRLTLRAGAAPRPAFRAPDAARGAAAPSAAAPDTPAQAAPARAADGLSFELRPLVGAGPLLAPVWEAMRARRAGMPARTAAWWSERILNDIEQDRHGAQPIRLLLARAGGGEAGREAAGEVRGYALYRTRAGSGIAATLEALELVAPDPEVEAALWGFLTSVDLIDRVEAFDRPLDDPLPYRLPDFRLAWPAEPAWPDALWLRLIDLPAALSARAWRAPLDLTLEVADRRLPRNAGRWRLRADGAGTAACERAGDGAAADLALDVSALGAAYLGGATAAILADAGRIEERTPGALARLDAALRVDRLPWTPDFF